jgi:uncharacterized protein YjiS (DUF1127 family)
MGRSHGAKHAKQDWRLGAASATWLRGIVDPQKAAACDVAACPSWTRHTMLFLDLYGIPGVQPDATSPRLPRILASLADRIAAWKRESYDRRTLSRMTIRQLEDLQLSWPDDIRSIRAQS